MSFRINTVFVLASVLAVQAWALPPGEREQIRSRVESITSVPRDAQIDLRYDLEAYRAIEWAISQAHETLDMDFYIFGGPLAEKSLQLLEHKIKVEGVRVRFLLDASLGKLPDHVKYTRPTLARLKAMGVEIHFYNTKSFSSFSAQAPLDHDKYIVVDGGKVAVMGSTNVAPMFETYHDVMMVIYGEITHDLGAIFELDWYNANHPNDPIVVSQRSLLIGESRGSVDRDGSAILIGNGMGRQSAGQAAIQMIRQARESIQIQMHELGDYTPLMKELRAARERGVRIEVLLDPNDWSLVIPYGKWLPSPILNALSVSVLQKMGAEVRYYPVSMDAKAQHLKIMVVDGKRAVVSSMNLTQGGMFGHVAEIGLALFGGNGTRQASERFAHDWQISTVAKPPGFWAKLVNHLYDFSSAAMERMARMRPSRHRQLTELPDQVQVPERDSRLKFFYPKEGIEPKGVVLVGHGINHDPARMDYLCEYFADHGLVAARLTLDGHDDASPASREIFKNVTRDEWHQNLLDSYRESKRVADALGVPIDFVGYSLSGLMMEDLQNTPQGAEVQFDRRVLLAPALTLRHSVQFLHDLHITLPGWFPIPLPPFARNDLYQYTPQIPNAGLDAGGKGIDEIRKAGFSGTRDSSTLVMMDPFDPIVPVKDLAALLRRYDVKWPIALAYRDQRSIHKTVDRHLINEPSLSTPREWEAIAGGMTNYLTGTLPDSLGLPLYKYKGKTGACVEGYDSI